MTLLGTRSVPLQIPLLLRRAGLLTSMLGTNGCVPRLATVTINSNNCRINNSGNLSRRQIDQRNTNDLLTTRGVVRGRTTCLIAKRRNMIVPILSDGARPITIQINDRRRINKLLHHRLRHAFGNLTGLKIKVKHNKRVTVQRFLLQRCHRVPCTGTNRRIPCQRVTNTIRKHMGRLRPTVRTRTKIRLLNRRHLRVNLRRVHANLRGRTLHRNENVIHYFRVIGSIRHTSAVHRDVNVIINRLATVYTMTLMTIVLKKIITNNSRSAHLATMVPRHRTRRQHELRLKRRVRLRTNDNRRPNNLLNRTIKLSAKIRKGHRHNDLMTHDRMIDRTLHDLTRNMSIRTIVAHTSSTPRATNTGNRLPMRSLTGLL